MISSSILEINGIECISIEINFPNSKPILVSFIYRPPSSSAAYLDTLDSMISKTDADGNPTIILYLIRVTHALKIYLLRLISFSLLPYQPDLSQDLCLTTFTFLIRIMSPYLEPYRFLLVIIYQSLLIGLHEVTSQIQTNISTLITDH
jgi:hypothetical protein